MEAGELCGKTEKIGLNGRNQVGVGGISTPSASVRFRGHPRYLWAEDGRWKLWNYEGKQRNIVLNGRNQGGDGGYIASVSLLQLPRTSVEIRAMCGRKTENGSCGIMREKVKLA